MVPFEELDGSFEIVAADAVVVWAFVGDEVDLHELVAHAEPSFKCIKL